MAQNSTQPVGRPCWMVCTKSGKSFFDQVLGARVGVGVAWTWRFGAEPQALEGFSASVSSHRAAHLGAHPLGGLGTVPRLLCRFSRCQFSLQFGFLLHTQQARSA